MSGETSAAPATDAVLSGEEQQRAASEPLLNQAEIDEFLGWRAPSQPLRAWHDQAPEGGSPSREGLPLVAAMLNSLVVGLGANLRGLLGSEAAFSLSAVRSVRYADFIEEVVLPAQVVVFRAEEWGGDGLVALGPALGQLLLDALLGAGRVQRGAPAAARPFSPIETAILTRVVDAVLVEAEAAFRAVAPVTFRRTRVETDPRLANVAAPADHALAATITVSVAGRAGEFAILLPSSTLEPIREQLSEAFVGPQLGPDERWSTHLATELWRAGMEAEAVLHETILPLRRISDLAIGETLLFDMTPTDPVEIRSGGTTITRGRIGRAGGHIAVQITEPVRACAGTRRGGARG